MFLIFFMLICQRWYFMSKKFVYLMFYVSLRYTFLLFFFFLVKFFCEIFWHWLELLHESHAHLSSRANVHIEILIRNQTIEFIPVIQNNFTLTLHQPSLINLPARNLLRCNDPWQSHIFFCQQKHHSLLVDFLLLLAVFHFKIKRSKSKTLS